MISLISSNTLTLKQLKKRMKTFLKFTLLLIFSLSSFQIFSQSPETKENILKQVVENSKLIFEGKILSQGLSFRAKNNAIYTSYEVQLDKVIYGTTTSSKITLITEGGEIEENGMKVGTSTPHGIELKLNSNSTIFCQPFTFGSANEAYLVTEQVCYNSKNEIIITNHLSEYYKSINDLYKDLSQKLNIKIPEKKSPDVSESIKISNTELINYSDNLNNYNNRISFFTSKNNNSLNQKANNVLANDLTLSTGNEQITAVGSTRFLEFDVFAKANVNGLYFDNCLLRIQYNTSSFGSNMMAAGNATITKGALFNSSTYINPQANSIDQNSNTLGIPFGIEYTQTPLNRTVLTTTNKILLHIRLKIQNCGQTSDLQFVDAASISFLNFYTTTANASATAGNSFDNSTYISPPTNVLCSVIIDDFNTPVSGGKGDILTVTGLNFGATRGNGKVRFRNANAAGFPFLAGLDNNDYISWTDTEIKIKFPSTTILNGAYNVPGSGAFIVKNNLGDSSLALYNSSFQSLVVPYSIDNRVDNGNKYKLNLKNVNGLGGYTIRLDTSISNYPDKKGCVIKAMRDWRCLSGVNLVLGNDTSIANHATDNITTIAFTPTLVATQVAGTFVNYQVCTSGGIAMAIPDFDTQISRQFNFLYDTTGLPLPVGLYDFYEIMVHEIGHGLGLEHVIDTNLIMYRTSKAAYGGVSLPASQRRKLAIYSGDADGGLFQVSSSPTNIHGQCATYASHQIVNSSCSQVGILEVIKDKYNFSVYPNPTDGDIVNISYKANTQSSPKITISDVTGRILYIANVNDYTTGTNKYTLSLNGFSTGLYFIQLTIDGYSFSQKIIKN